jgi:hypothetical protein
LALYLEGAVGEGGLKVVYLLLLIMRIRGYLPIYLFILFYLAGGLGRVGWDKRDRMERGFVYYPLVKGGEVGWDGGIWGK